ncbi:Pentatricopeptide repeat-containing protein At1g59720, chloroplastic/mitochondrial [Linum perenne]
MSYGFPNFQRRRSAMVVSSMDFNFPSHGSYSYKKSVPSSGFVESATPWKFYAEQNSIKKPSLVVEVSSVSQWRAYFDANSKDNSKLLVIKFTATWCGPCRHMEPVMEEFAGRYTDVVFIKIDVDKLPSVARQFDVQIMPAFALIKKGKEVDKVGGVKKNELQNKIEKHRLPMLMATTATVAGNIPIDLHDRLLRRLNECTSISQLKQVHAQTLRYSTIDNPRSLFLQSRILHFSSLKDLDYAHRVFNQVEAPNSFMWNTLIRAYAQSNDRKDHAFMVFEKMLLRGTASPDNHTFPFVLKACSYLFALAEGEQAHGQLVKRGLESDAYVGNSLIHFYGSCGCLELSRKVFDKMPERTVVSWNAMIDSFVRLGEFQMALEFFVQLQQESFEPDGYAIQSVLNACAGLSALSLGMWVHACILRSSGADADLARDVLVNNSLVDMYCKCGALNMAMQVFERMEKRDLTSWNSMILGLGMHGKGELALEYFDNMVEKERILPNSVTFVGVLSACNHRFMVNDGRKYFDSMVNEYRIEPRLEHYGCLVDILARAGLIDEALDLISTMHVKPDAVIWRSLLDACCKNNASVELSKEMALKILESGGGNDDCSGVYVLLSKVYASANRWNDAGLIRKLMADKGIAKQPGCSLIEIDGITHELFAGDTSHPRAKQIYRALEVIQERLESAGYTPDTIPNDHNNDEQSSLRLHSERLAIALGLISTKRGTPIRIFKNLRVCNDCHRVTKLVSKIFNVEIIVRDRARFHHFKHGSCSCMDYW